MSGEESKLELEELNSSYKELGHINDRQEKRVQHLETKTIWLVTSYIFFQGIIFFSISHPSNISCNHWSQPFSLSLSVAIIFGLTFISTINKWERTQYHYELNLLDGETLYHKMFLIKQKRVKMGSTRRQQQEVLKPDMFRVYQRQAFIYLMDAVLLAFTVVILRACYTISCNKLA